MQIVQEINFDELEIGTPFNDGVYHGYYVGLNPDTDEPMYAKWRYLPDSDDQKMFVNLRQNQHWPYIDSSFLSGDSIDTVVNSLSFNNEGNIDIELMFTPNYVYFDIITWYLETHDTEHNSYMDLFQSGIKSDEIELDWDLFSDEYFVSNGAWQDGEITASIDGEEQEPISFDYFSQEEPLFITIEDYDYNGGSSPIINFEMEATNGSSAATQWHPDFAPPSDNVDPSTLNWQTEVPIYRDDYKLIEFNGESEKTQLVEIPISIDNQEVINETFLITSKIGTNQTINYANEILTIEYYDPTGVKTFNPNTTDIQIMMDGYENDSGKSHMSLNTKWINDGEINKFTLVPDEFVYYDQPTSKVKKGRDLDSPNIRDQIIIPWDYSNNTGELFLSIETETYSDVTLDIIIDIGNEVSLRGESDSQYNWIIQDIKDTSNMTPSLSFYSTMKDLINQYG